MKKILILPILLASVIAIFGTGCSNEHKLQDFPSDTIDVYSRLESNNDWYFYQRTYGKDSIIGSHIQYRAATDSSEVYLDFDITILELHPKITANLLSFVHNEMWNWRFVNESDTIFPSECHTLSPLV